MIYNAIEAALVAFWCEPNPNITLRERMIAAIAAYEQALWQKEEICEGALCHLINGEVWYRPLTPPPGKEG